LPETSADIGATLCVPASSSLGQHGPERVVATPEMVVERRCGMKGDYAYQKKSDRRMRLSQLPRKRPVSANQRRQLTEEEQVHPVAVSIGP